MKYKTSRILKRERVIICLRDKHYLVGMSGKKKERKIGTLKE